MSYAQRKNGSEPIESAFFRLKEKVATLRTEPIAARKNRLKKLRAWIHEHRASVHEALYADLEKPAMETDGTELFHVLNEINYAINNLTGWTSRKKVDAPVTMIGTRSFLQYEPKGLCLIIAPWNYPFSLCVGPLISSLAAGNACIVKPSELTPHVSSIIKKMVTEVFGDEVVTVIEGDANASRQLLALPFDHIFFTGSPEVGKIVMKAAAEHLSSVTLELGGKSPAIVTASAKLDDAAQRIVVAKFINNGQTCLAPDYVLVNESVALPFVQKAIKELNALFRERDQSFEDSKHYARIVNERHFDRLENLLQVALDEGSTLAFSGGVRNRAELFFPPTILTRADGKLPMSNDEVFGPILPVITYRNIETAIALINSKPKPLALYIFSSRQSEKNKILQETSSGGVCVNDCAVHFLHHNLPFGGVGNSGMGRSHGYAGFLAFSNEKSVMKQRKGFTSVKAFYPPYTSVKQKLMNLFLKFF